MGAMLTLLGRAALARPWTVFLASCLASSILAPAPTAAQAPGTPCDRMVVRAGETVHASATDCIVDYRVGEASVRMILTRYDDPAEACAMLEDKRREHSRTEPRGVIRDLGAEYGERSYEIGSPQYAVEFMEGETRVVDIHPAKFDLLWCRAPYRFYAYSLYTPRDAPGVPREIIDDIRARARAAADGAPGEPATPQEGIGIMEALGTSAVDAFRDLIDQGVLDYEDVLNHINLTRGSPESKAMNARFEPLLRGRDLNHLSDAEKQVVVNVSTALTLANIEGPDGLPAFPAVAANLEVLTRLGLTGLQPDDPARAHQARTALDRYAGLLRTMDLQALDSRMNPPTGPGTTPP